MIRLLRAYQNRLVDGEGGASTAEYALPVALLVVVVIARWALFLGLKISDKFSQVGNAMRATEMARRNRTREDRDFKGNRARRDEIESKRWSQVFASSNRVEDADPEEVEARIRNLTHGTNSE